MALEDKTDSHVNVVDKFHDPVDTYDMNVRDYVVRPSAPDGGMNLVLPPVADAKGRFYSIIALAATAVNTIAITDQGDSECWLGDIILNGKCDRALMYSDGRAWIALGGNPGAWPGFATTDAPGTTEAPTTRGSTAPPTTTLTTAAQ